MTDRVQIFEMAPRDGLQNEKRPIPTAEKIRLVDLLSEVGFAKIEAVSFVNPRRVPQMADGAEVMAGARRRPDVRLTALTPNLKGYARAKAAGVDEIAIFASATEGFSRSNLGMSRAEALEMFRPVAEAAAADRMPMRAYVSCAAICPFDGDVPPADVAAAVEALLALGAYEVSLGDTVGRGAPEMIDAMLKAACDVAPAHQLAGHYHDTNGRALENIAVSLDHGLRTFDAAAGGLGGCPFAPGAKGNVATEAVAAMLHDRGFDHGLDLTKLAAAAAFAKTLRGEE